MMDFSDLISIAMCTGKFPPNDRRSVGHNRIFIVNPKINAKDKIRLLLVFTWVHINFTFKFIIIKFREIFFDYG